MNGSKMFLADIFDPKALLEDLEKSGAVSVPMLKESFRQQLEDEAKRLKAWSQLDGQDIYAFTQFPPTSLYVSIRKKIIDFLRKMYKDNSIAPPNQMMLKKYYPGCSMRPHKDATNVTGLVYNLQIAGSASFYLCNYDRTHRHDIDTAPGNLIVFAGHNLVGKNGIIDPHYHGVDNVTETRYSLLLFNCT